MAMKINEDLALLDFRNTPSQGMDSSPVQRLMNRRTKTLLPTTSQLLVPKSSNTELDRDKLRLKQEKQAHRYNKSAKDLPVLSEGDVVRMQPFILGKKEWQKAIVTSRLDERSYNVETPNGTYRRNRVHLRRTPEAPPCVVAPEPPTPSVTDNNDPVVQTSVNRLSNNDIVQDSPTSTARRSGRTTSKPEWMKDFVTK